MKFKKIIATAMVAATLLTSGVSTTAFAETTEAHEPALCYEMLNTAVPMLDIIGTTAYCETTANATSSVTSMTMVQTLQRKGLILWSDVDGASWTKTVSASDIAMYESFTVSKSGKYRVEVEITMTDGNGNTETVTFHSVEVDVKL